MRRAISSRTVAQAIVVVAQVPHRQQLAILGVEDEEQPIEQGERGFLQLGEIGGEARGRALRVAGVEGLDDGREHLAEDQLR